MRDIPSRHLASLKSVRLTLPDPWREQFETDTAIKVALMYGWWILILFSREVGLRRTKTIDRSEPLTSPLLKLQVRLGSVFLKIAVLFQQYLHLVHAYSFGTLLRSWSSCLF